MSKVYPPHSRVLATPSQDHSPVASFNTGASRVFSFWLPHLPADHPARMAFFQLFPTLQCLLTHTPDSFLIHAENNCCRTTSVLLAWTAESPLIRLVLLVGFPLNGLLKASSSFLRLKFGYITFCGGFYSIARITLTNSTS